MKKQSQSHCIAKFGAYFLFGVQLVKSLAQNFFYNNLKYISLLLVSRKKLKILFGACVSYWKTFLATYAKHIIAQKILISSILTVIFHAM